MKKKLLYISLFILLNCGSRVLAQEQENTSSKEYQLVIKLGCDGKVLAQKQENTFSKEHHLVIKLDRDGKVLTQEQENTSFKEHYLVIKLDRNGRVLEQKQKSTFFKDHHFAIKTNLAAIPLGNINLAGEIGLNPKNTAHPLTLHVPVSYNPFTYSNNAKLKHFAVQPELRLWQKEAFNKFFVGLHAHYAYYNAGGISGINKKLKENRYQGNLFGMGVSGGYTHMINDKFGIESALGFGYALMNHDIHDCQRCGSKTGEESRIYFGPTKLAISLVYKIR